MGSDSEKTKCRKWVPTPPRPHFCSLAVEDACPRCNKTYCARHINRHECER